MKIKMAGPEATGPARAELSLKSVEGAGDVLAKAAVQRTSNLPYAAIKAVQAEDATSCTCLSKM